MFVVYNEVLGLDMGRKISCSWAGALFALSVLALGCGNKEENGSLRIPRGSTISVSMDTTVSSRTNRKGDRFAASLTTPFRQGEKMFVPLNVKVDGVVDSVDKHDGREQIQVHLTRLHLPGGRTLALGTNPIVRDAKPAAGNQVQPVDVDTGLDKTIKELAGDSTLKGPGNLPQATLANVAVIPAGSPLVFTLASDLVIPPPPASGVPQ